MLSFKKMMKIWNFLFENKILKVNLFFLVYEYMNCLEFGVYV